MIDAYVSQVGFVVTSASTATDVVFNGSGRVTGVDGTEAILDNWGFSVDATAGQNQVKGAAVDALAAAGALLGYNVVKIYFPDFSIGRP